MPVLAAPGDPPGPTPIGRDREFNTLAAKIDAIRDGGAALVVRGEAGIGKSTLLRAVTQHALSRGLDVLMTTAVQSEIDLPYAGLNPLLLPLRGTRERLSGSSRNAIDAVFGQTEAAVSSPFLVALATLQLLGERDDGEPLVMLVDDAQWLDPASADALAFVARRVESEPIVLIFAFRDDFAFRGGFALRDGFGNAILDAALPELTLQPLDDTAAAELLDTRSPLLAHAVRDRILQDAAGNPLALVELPVAVRAAGLENALPPPWLPLTARLTRIFSERFATLSATTRTFLLIAAADDTGNLTEILAAAARLTEVDTLPEAVSESSSAGLIEVDGSEMRFRHPLMRSAIYDSARLLERQAAHAALADVVMADADRRAWHLAGGIVGADEQAALALEQAARRASNRGAATTAFRMMDRAARVSKEASLRSSRSLWAADLALEAGRSAEVVRILNQLNVHELPASDRPYLAFLRDIANVGPWSGASTVAGFAHAADRLREQREFGRAIRALWTVSLRCWWSNPDAATRGMIIAAAERIPLAEDDPELLTVLALAAPEERGAVVIERLRRVAAQPFSSLPTHLLGVAATGVGDFGAAERFLDAAVATLRTEGSLGILAQAQVSLAWTGILRGNWRAAARSADEAIRLGEETRQPRWVAVAKTAAATLAAYQGFFDTAEALATSAEQEFVPSHANPMLALVQFARGAASLAAGLPDAGYERLSRIYRTTDVAYHPHVRAWTLVDLVEAAVHSNHRAEVQVLVEEQAQLLRRTRSPLLQVHVGAARALLAPDGEAEEYFRTILDDHATASPFLRARLQLAYGAWLKRRHRVADSRPQLRAALETFNALGGSPWAARAARELRASGETRRRRVPSAGWLALSPQELQIAELAADGLSNKDIAQQLFLSHRTVGTHLYRIFPKLGVTSRAQLQKALSRRPVAGSPPD